MNAWFPHEHRTASGEVVFDGQARGEGGPSRPLPAYVGVGQSNPGGAAVSRVGTDLATFDPVVSLLDGAALTGPFALARDGDTLIACCTWGTDGSPFIGHDMKIIYRSTDKGATWEGATTPFDAGIGSDFTVAANSPIPLGGGEWYCLATHGSTGFGSDLHVLHSTDDGLTWTAVGTSPGTSFGTIAYDGTYFFVTCANGSDGANTDAASVFRSTDLSTWEPVTTGFTMGAALGLYATPSVVLVTANQAQGDTSLGLARSTDHGASWTLLDAGPYAGAVYPYALATDGAGDWIAWMVDQSSNFGFSWIQSLDDGATWSTDDPVAAPWAISFSPMAFRTADGWFSVWGPTVAGVGSGNKLGYIAYTAPVENPLVWTPTGYAAPNMQAPLALVPVA